MASQSRRSDVVRARRSQRRSSSSRTSKSKGSSNRRSVPPMVTRTSYTSRRPASKRPEQENRRRYDIALPTTGAEIRLPSISVPRLSWRLLSFVLVLALSYVFYYLWTSPRFTVMPDRITINGIQRVNTDELLAYANIEDKPVFMIDPSGLETLLEEKVRALKEISVHVSFSGEVTIDLVERVPLIAWDQHLINTVWWVDEDGMRFPAIGSSEGLVYVRAEDPPPKPPPPPDEADESEGENQGQVDGEQAKQTTGKDDGLLMEPQLVKGIVAIKAYLPEGAELVYDKEKGIGWKDPQYGWLVYFGKKLDQMPLRLKIYQAIIDYVQDKNRQPVLISVEYIHAPYYRMEP